MGAPSKSAGSWARVMWAEVVGDLHSARDMKRLFAFGLLVGTGLLACAPTGGDGETETADLSSSPVSLSSGQHRPTALVMDATHVYWTTYAPSGDRAPFDRRYDVLRVAKEGGRVETLATDQKDLVGLTLDESHVYWLARTAGECTTAAPTGVARRVGKSVGGQAVESIATGLPCGSPSANTQAVIDEGRLYWSGDDGIRAVAKAGGTPEMFAEAGPNPNASVRSTVLLRQDETRIFWGDSYGPLWAQPKRGGDKVKLLDRSPWQAAVDGGSLYYSSEGAIWRVSKAGGAPERVGPSEERGEEALAVDDTHVYWTNTVEDAIRRLPKSGAAAAETWVKGERAYAIDVDASGTYYAFYGRDRSGMIPEYIARSGAIRHRPMP